MTAATEHFAAEYARNAVPNMLKAIDTIKRYNRFTLLAALATSYLHQAHYLWTQKAGYFAYLVPLIFDAAMVSMLIVVRTPGITRDAKRSALAVFTGASLLSATVNYLAPGSVGLRLIFALVVVLVIGVELVAGRIRPDFEAIEEQAADLLAAANKIKVSTPDTDTEPVGAAPAASAEPSTPAVTTTAASDSPADPVPAVLPATDGHDHAEDLPARLISAARMVTVQHRQTSGQPLTPGELAARLGTTETIAARLLAAIDNPPPARLNGHSPAFGGVR
ncbi:DUF2637 domain-containing protein [Couchioplanes azureus]|uniref:DUF2637 domain-containing protein n=1 Tax=Couchioplanes caeruleus TaxID=56438 RepID=UPI00166F7373|nr:DUF2637 domain-containing protein [Couchioplanes caeruleus]GGQ86769.1 hypothetical protein GCM10010166_66150 [Couchioplanes caeruleus subsp. azureus]